MRDHIFQLKPNCVLCDSLFCTRGSYSRLPCTWETIFFSHKPKCVLCDSLSCTMGSYSRLPCTWDHIFQLYPNCVLCDSQSCTRGSYSRLPCTWETIFFSHKPNCVMWFNPLPDVLDGFSGLIVLKRLLSHRTKLGLRDWIHFTQVGTVFQAQ
jgi:hypothetical protein